MKERIKFITATVLYGTIGLFLRYVELPSEAVALYRGILGALTLWVFRLLRKERPDAGAIRNNLLWLLLSGVGLGLNWIFLFAAYVNTTVAIASLCNYMAPILVICLTPLVLKEKLDLRKIPCILAALVGIVLVSGVIDGGIVGPSGVVFGLLGACCFVGIVFCNRKLHDISPFDRALVQLAVSALTVLPYVLIKNKKLPLPGDLKSGLIVLMLGVLQTGVAYCLYFSGMANLPLQSVAILGYIEPVVSVLCSVLFLKEPLGWYGWIGAVLILAAAVISEIIPPKNPPKEAEK
ncbi:MAG: EamA family transporter [Clostridia bacterium]|nr:EamA family transporter [Clostridia bacterium]